LLDPLIHPQKMAAEEGCGIYRSIQPLA